MSFNQVKIFYGPCTTFHSMEHKPQLVKGIQDRLQKLGYKVDLHKISYINYCMLEMCAHEVFRCNLKNLKFNTHYTRDVVAQRAINAVVYASVKFNLARNHLWFRDLIKYEMFARGPYAPKDYWPVEVEVKPYTTCNQCVACCDILVSKKPVLKEETSSRYYGFNHCPTFDLPLDNT